MSDEANAKRQANFAPCTRTHKLNTIPAMRSIHALLPLPMQGHMVPMDQPAAALDMISRFTRNQSLVQPGFFDIRPVAQQQVEHRSVQAGAMEQAEQQVQAS
jgi:hypothetical protein